MTNSIKNKSVENVIGSIKSNNNSILNKNNINLYSDLIANNPKAISIDTINSKTVEIPRISLKTNDTSFIPKSIKNLVSTKKTIGDNRSIKMSDLSTGTLNKNIIGAPPDKPKIDRPFSYDIGAGWFGILSGISKFIKDAGIKYKHPILNDKIIKKYSGITEDISIVSPKKEALLNKITTSLEGASKELADSRDLKTMVEEEGIPKTVGRLVASALPQVGLNIALSLTGGKTPIIASGWILEYQNIKDNILQQNPNIKTKDLELASTLYATAATTIENVMGVKGSDYEKIFKGVAPKTAIKNVVLKLLKEGKDLTITALEEGLEEGIQQTTQNIISDIALGKKQTPQSILSGIPESVVRGGVGSLGFSGAKILSQNRQGIVEGTKNTLENKQGFAKIPWLGENKQEIAPMEENKSFIFVSPNIKEGLTLPQAEKELQSDRQKEFRQSFNNTLFLENIKGEFKDAIGDWADGSENTAYLELDNMVDPDVLKYVGAKNALNASQKQYIWFNKNNTGKDQVISIDTKGINKTNQEIKKLLEDNGIMFKTIGNNKVFIFNKSGEYFDENIADKVIDVLDDLKLDNSKYIVYNGDGNFEGSWMDGEEAREDAKNIYTNQIIQPYESRKQESTQNARIEEDRQKSLDKRGAQESGRIVGGLEQKVTEPRRISKIVFDNGRTGSKATSISQEEGRRETQEPATVEAKKAEELILPTLSNIKKGQVDSVINKLENIIDKDSKVIEDRKDTKKEDTLINVAYYNLPEEQKNYIKQTMEILRPEVEKARGKKMTFNEMLNAAATSDILEQIISRDENLGNIASALRTKQEIALQTEKGLTKEYYENLKNVSAFYTAMGRALASGRVKIDPVMGVEIVSIKADILKEIQKVTDNIDAVLEAGKDVNWDNPSEVTKFYRSFIKPKIGEILAEYRYINLLSSPKTHIVNAFTNLLQAFVQAPLLTKLPSGIIDMVASTITGRDRQIFLSEVPAYYRGLFSAMPEAIKNVKNVMAGKMFINRPDVRAIPTNHPVLKKFQFITKFLEAGDMFFGTLIKGGEREALVEKAKKQGKEITKVMKDKIEEDAGNKALYYLFRKTLDPKNKTGQGAVLSAIDQFTSGVYNLRKFPIVSWFVPFVQTPMNILKQGIEYSPLGLATTIGNKNKIEQLAKAFSGSLVFALGGMLALMGRSTWEAPTDEKEKEAFYAAGMKPYSVKIGNKWVEYSRLGPLAYPLAMAASIQWYWRENPKKDTNDWIEKTIKTVGGIAGFFSDQSYISGIGDLIDAARGDTTAINRAMSNLPGQLVPLASLQRWVSQIIDPTYRKPNEDTNTFQRVIEEIMTGIPILSKKLPAYIDLEGGESKRERLNLISPIGITTEKPGAKESLGLVREAQRLRAMAKQEQTQVSKELDNLYGKLKLMPKDEAKKVFSDLIKSDPEKAKKLSAKIQAEQRGLKFNDEVLLSLGVTDGNRARVIFEEFIELKDNESKKKLWSEYVTKKIITEDVARQLIYLIEQTK